MKSGYTLIELLLTLTLTSLLLGFGISSYRRAQTRQIGRLAAETILSLLYEQQKAANIGSRDPNTCLGPYLGQQLSVSQNANEFAIRSLCRDSLGPTTVTTIDGITFNQSATATFLPLSQGIDLGAASELNLDFTASSSLVYRIHLSKAGSIEFQGQIP